MSENDATKCAICDKGRKARTHFGWSGHTFMSRREQEARLNAAKRGGVPMIEREILPDSDGEGGDWMVRARPEMRERNHPIEIKIGRDGVRCVTVWHAMRLRAELNAVLPSAVVRHENGHDHTEYIDGCRVQPHHCDRYVDPSCQTCWPDGGMREQPEDDSEGEGHGP